MMKKSKKSKKIPQAAITRLSLYFRGLSESRRSTGYISSEELSRLTGIPATQIRKDLTYFGQFGTPGKGFDIKLLGANILKILGIDQRWKLALVGVGNLGSALLTYPGFEQQGFKIVAAFDINLLKVGKVLDGVRIYDMGRLPQIIKEQNIKMAIVTVPAQAAQSVVNQLAAAGIKAILNFAPVRIKVPPEVKLLNIDMTIELERLSYLATHGYGL